MQKRISKELKAIADAHIQAKISGFNPVPCKSREELVEALKSGATYPQLLEGIETRFCTVTSLLASNLLGVTYDSYRKQVHAGFKSLFSNSI
jgi:hypothetical protein